MLISSPDKAKRLQAARLLAGSDQPATKSLLLERLAPGAETDAEVRAALSASLDKVQSRLAWGERLGVLFTGISLGSILLLVALGLAITYGLMGVINMAHGELMMIGAYATYVVQNAVPAATCRGCSTPTSWPRSRPSFLAAALVGAVLERSVIRLLYGRPLETLLATWGISLVLMQAVRTLFGAQNVGSRTRRGCRAACRCCRNLTLPYNRLAILAFAALVLAGMALLIAQHAPGPVRARRDAEPAHGRLHGRQHRARRHLRLLARRRHRRPGGLRAEPGRQRRARPGPGLHRRLVHGRRAGRRRAARRHRVRRRSAWAC